MKITKEEAIKQYGFNPEKVGLRHRGFWVEEDGRLCINARDGGGNELDCEAGEFGDYDGCVNDDFDITFVYYYYKKI